MKFFAVAALFAGALAMPTAEIEDRTDHDGGHGGHGGSGYEPCSGLLNSNPVCVATDVLGLACLNAYIVPETPTSAKNFRDICAARGQQPRCALLNLLGQAILCQKPVGI